MKNKIYSILFLPLIFSCAGNKNVWVYGKAKPYGLLQELDIQCPINNDSLNKYIEFTNTCYFNKPLGSYYNFNSYKIDNFIKPTFSFRIKSFTDKYMVKGEVDTINFENSNGLVLKLGNKYYKLVSNNNSHYIKLLK